MPTPGSNSQSNKARPQAMSAAPHHQGKPVGEFQQLRHDVEGAAHHGRQPTKPDKSGAHNALLFLPQ
jgi:hypothetical protein